MDYKKTEFIATSKPVGGHVGLYYDGPIYNTIPSKVFVVTKEETEGEPIFRALILKETLRCDPKLKWVKTDIKNIVIFDSE